MRTVAIVCLLCAAGAAWLAPGFEEPPVHFVDVAESAGVRPIIASGSKAKNYVLEVNGSGVCWFDYNNDGYTDLYLVNGTSLEDLRKPSANTPHSYLFRNNGDGTFTDVTAAAGVPNNRMWGFGCVTADYDNDGNQDLLILNFGPNVLYHNNGDGTFTDVTAKAGLGGGNIWHAGAAFGDYDNDGFLDVYISGYLDFDIVNPPNTGCEFAGVKVKACGPAGYKGAPDALYHNNGDGTFTDVTVKAGVVDKELYFGFAVIFDDFDNDGRPDIFVANDSNPNYLYHNNGDGTFKEIGVASGAAYSLDGKEFSNMGVAVGDYDNDGLMDLFIGTFADDNDALFHNEGRNFFTEVSYPAGVGEPTIPFVGWGTTFLDYNNDGLKDLFVANGHVYPEIDSGGKFHYLEPLQLFENTGQRKFRDVSAAAGLRRLPLHSARGLAACDYDNDGDVDIVVSNIDERPQLLRNEGGNRAHWLELKAIGTASNRDGIGAQVKLVSGDLTQYEHVRAGVSFLSSNDIRLHFGLGARQKIDLLEIRWPSGKLDTYQNLEVNKIFAATEGKGIQMSNYKPFRSRTARVAAP